MESPDESRLALIDHSAVKVADDAANKQSCDNPYQNGADGAVHTFFRVFTADGGANPGTRRGPDRRSGGHTYAACVLPAHLPNFLASKHKFPRTERRRRISIADQFLVRDVEQCTRPVLTPRRH